VNGFLLNKYKHIKRIISCRRLSSHI
jgi:hypothetical protein